MLRLTIERTPPYPPNIPPLHPPSLPLHVSPHHGANMRTHPPPPAYPISPSTHPQQESTYLTNPDRDAIDSSSKTLLRDLNASIRQLSEAESIRRTSQLKVLESRYSKGLLGRWAAGEGQGEESGAGC
ncbi:hypothetical protein ABVK25_009196 [Lepraria finkii]|uniref:Uncharacterized protein n=1 Tax=Lepraria finkii TaxID=1340010 RepID=A0ABR4AXZ1_9LECA